MNNPITKTIIESLDEFNKYVPPPPSFSDIQEIIHAWERMQPPENYTATEAMMAENEWKRRMALWRQIKSHLLQSQIKVIEAVIEEMKSKLRRVEDGKDALEQFGIQWLNKPIEDQISSLNDTLEFLKKSL